MNDNARNGQHVGRKRFLAASAVAALGGLTISCSGGSGGGGDSTPPGPPPPPPPSSAETYLFYTEAGTTAAIDALWVTDPANPTAPTKVDTGPIAGVDIFGGGFPITIKIYHGSYAAGTGTVSDAHVRTAVYAKNGRLYRVSALKGASAPAPVQLSNEVGASKICSYSTAEDFANHDNAQFVYQVPGGDNNCATSGDNAWKMVRVGMGATTAPLSAKPAVGSLYDATTGALTGWLVLDGTTLNRYNADFGSPAQVDTGVSSPSLEYVAKNGDVILRVTKGGSKYLKRYNPTTGSLSDIHNSATCCSDAVSDGTYMYFADANVVYRYPFDGSASRSALITEAAGRTFDDLYTTTSAVIYRLTATVPDPNPALKAGRKSDGFISTLVPGSPTPSVVATAGNFIYYTVGGAAAVIKDDGTGGGTHANASWLGATYERTISFIGDRAPVHILLANTSAGSMAGQPLVSYAAASHTVAAALGTVESDVTAFLPGLDVPGTKIVMTGDISGSSMNDVFFVDTARDNSLVRVAYTPTVNEFGCAFNPRARGVDPVLPILVVLSAWYLLRRRRAQ